MYNNNEINMTSKIWIYDALILMSMYNQPAIVFVRLSNQ